MARQLLSRPASSVYVTFSDVDLLVGPMCVLVVPLYTDRQHRDRQAGLVYLAVSPMVKKCVVESGRSVKLSMLVVSLRAVILPRMLVPLFEVRYMVPVRPD